MDLYQPLQQSLILVLQMSMPVVLAATAVGLIVGLLQTLTSIQDQTLSHAVKLVAVAIVIGAFGALLSSRLLAFTNDVFSRIAAG